MVHEGRLIRQVNPLGEEVISKLLTVMWVYMLDWHVQELQTPDFSPQDMCEC